MQKGLGKIVSYVLVLCMLITGIGQMNTSMAKAAESTTVYFLNDQGWNSIGAYVYGVGEALGPWPGITPEAATEIGSDWYQVEVPANAPFNIIFFHTAADAERAELQIPSEQYVYVTSGAQVYSTSLEAEISVGRGDLM